jgi:hypothetical protein
MHISSIAAERLALEKLNCFASFESFYCATFQPLFLCESFLLLWRIVGPGIESESIRVFPAGAKESDSLFYDFSRIV